MPKRVSDEDRALAQKLFAQGLSSRDVSNQLGSRVSPSWVQRTSATEGWLRGVLPPDLITEDNPQIYESVKAEPDEQNANTAKLEAATRRKFAQRKLDLADRMAGKIDVLLDQMFGQHVVKEIKLVGMGGGVQEVKLVEVALDEPSPTDKKHLATTLAILVDKASLLVGDATSRVETAKLSGTEVADRLKHFRDELEERRRQAEATPAPKEAAG